MIKELFTKEYPFLIMQNRILILVSSCVTAILLLLHPFSIESFGRDLIFPAITYGFITFLGMYFFNNVIKKSIHKHIAVWTVPKEIIFILSLLLFISTLNYFFTTWYFKGMWEPHRFLSWLNITFSVGIFPTILVVMYIQYRHELEKNDTPPQPVVPQHLMTISDNRGNNSLTIPLQDFIFAESRGCTLYINYMHDNALKQYHMRASISNVEDAICSGNIVRCHRSFIVNIRYIDAIEGNSNGYKLYLKKGNNIIPVSRRYTLIVKDLLHKNSIAV